QDGKSQPLPQHQGTGNLGQDSRIGPAKGRPGLSLRPTALAQRLAVYPHSAHLQPAPLHLRAHRPGLFFLGRRSMKEQRPTPDFDAKRYVRPTQKWVCGKAEQGESCPLGPSRWGGCRATAECEPLQIPTPAYACKPQKEEREGQPTIYTCALLSSLGG